MKWVDGSEGDKVAIVLEPGQRETTLYVARTDGRLEIAGGDWKECPREKGADRCPREGYEHVTDFEVGNHPKCRRCSWSGVFRLESQEQAIRVADHVHDEIELAALIGETGGTDADAQGR